ncbi:AAA family ATPase [uncultured Herbaspirillum sp.]|uniref:ATP-dependent nuclease n=1 Tax=uncultured Herbaspirillum sp. TaxID=160236 RepID=UPI00258BBC93|nr:AAA family ATPase [uncultured Herbaspirillum sp.]
MATKKKEVIDAFSLVSDDPAVPRPRLHKLIIKNFRTVGSIPLEIELDEIVVLVGPNNVGKSTILRAYEVAMKQGSKEGKLSIDDFPYGKVDPAALPEIELHTIVFTKPGERWIARLENGEDMIRERWIWKSPNEDPKRQGFDVEKGDWDDQAPWGLPTVANSRRPLPHRIEAFSSPDTQAKEISELLLTILREKLKSLRSDDQQETSDYERLLGQIGDLQQKVVQSAQVEIIQIEKAISELLAKVFPKHVIKLDPKIDVDLEKTLTPFKASPELLMGPEDGYLSRISEQGSGARRTLLWTALRYLSESDVAAAASQRPHVLLLDEPEICLHPAAIREARKVLYDLPKSGNWQVMITTHSPVFIDLSQDNTTVVRVDRGGDNAVRSTTLFKPSKAKLDEDDKKNMKALNACDPYVNEFFFGSNIVIVEGDTEYTAFCLMQEIQPEKYSNLHIIRARGKGIIATLMKVLNQFSASYGVLHDSDTPMVGEAKNPAWGMNKSILLEKSRAADGRVRHVACLTDFEVALFGKIQKADKPYNALLKLRDNDALQVAVSKLLDSLISDSEPPANCRRWSSIEELEQYVAELD